MEYFLNLHETQYLDVALGPSDLLKIWFLTKFYNFNKYILIFFQYPVESSGLKLKTKFSFINFCLVSTQIVELFAVAGSMISGDPQRAKRRIHLSLFSFIPLFVILSYDFQLLSQGDKAITNRISVFFNKSKQRHFSSVLERLNGFPIRKKNQTKTRNPGSYGRPFVQCLHIFLEKKLSLNQLR